MSTLGEEALSTMFFKMTNKSSHAAHLTLTPFFSFPSRVFIRIKLLHNEDQNLCLYYVLALHPVSGTRYLLRKYGLMNTVYMYEVW